VRDAEGCVSFVGPSAVLVLKEQSYFRGAEQNGVIRFYHTTRPGRAERLCACG
jgi:hypothetical protein